MTHSVLLAVDRDQRSGADVNGISAYREAAGEISRGAQPAAGNERYSVLHAQLGKEPDGAGQGRDDRNADVLTHE